MCFGSKQSPILQFKEFFILVRLHKEKKQCLTFCFVGIFFLAKGEVGEDDGRCSPYLYPHSQFMHLVSNFLFRKAPKVAREI